MNLFLNIANKIADGNDALVRNNAGASNLLVGMRVTMMMMMVVVMMMTMMMMVVMMVIMISN